MNTNSSAFHSVLPGADRGSNSYGIRARLFAGFAFIGVILIAAIVIVLLKVSSSAEFAKSVVNVRLPALESSYDIEAQINFAELGLYGWLSTKDPFFKLQYTSALSNIDELQKTVNATTPAWQDNSQIKLWQKLQAQIQKFVAVAEKCFNAGTAQEAEVILKTEVVPQASRVLDLLDGPVDAGGNRVGGLFDGQGLSLKTGTQTIIDDLNTVKLIEITLLIISFFTFPFVVFYTARGISGYINVFRRHSNRVANGDLTQRISIGSQDEMGQLGNDLNVMTENLSSMAKQITAACHNMATSLEEVRHAVDVQSSGATEQASSINQITSSLEEIDKSSSQTIDKAKALGEVAERTREKGQLGLEAVEKSVEGMKSVREKVQTIAQTILDLSNQTQQVGEITAVVNSLAQQSKMLALNASIEAAKAGEAGKGFAVVASEVKNLAEQSEQSTTQVQKILEDIRLATEKAVMATEEGTKGVDHGTGLVEQTGEIVRNLSNVIHETTIATQQIEAAIRQENVGIEQITAGMNEINQVTSSFVDSVKQTTEAMGNLGDMVSRLKKNIDVYQV